MPRPPEKAVVRHRILWSYVLGLLVLAFALGSFLYIRWQIAQERTVQEWLAELNTATLRQLIEDVDSVCEKLGRTPEDQVELELLLGTSLPRIHAREVMMPIDYVRKTEKDYYLIYFSDGYRRFDSDQRDHGWTKVD